MIVLDALTVVLALATFGALWWAPASAGLSLMLFTIGYAAAVAAIRLAGFPGGGR